jgi:four helix bundle protein
MAQTIYDLEERTFQFAKRVRLFIKSIPTNTSNIEDSKQLIRASGSVGANYIEANESLSKKDFSMRIKICRKEAKECAFFIRLLKETNNQSLEIEANIIFNEAIELKKIFSAIIKKSG